MKIRATQAIMECLLEQEVDTVFGYPGGTILNLYDELYRYRDRIRHVLTAHEQGASHAADGLMIDQIAAQCRKLLPVKAVKIFDEESCIRREIALIKVRTADRAARDEIMQIINIFRAQVIDVDRECLTIWVFGSRGKNEALIGMLEDFGILEIAKTGTIAIERGRSTIYDDSKLKEEYDYGKNVL